MKGICWRCGLKEDLEDDGLCYSCEEVEKSLEGDDYSPLGG